MPRGTLYLHPRGAEMYLRPRYRRWQPSFPPSEAERPWWLETDLKEYYPEMEEGWELMESSICRMADICEQGGIGFLVFSVPIRSEVYPEAFEELMRSHNADPGLYDLEKSNRLMRELCDRNGLAFLDIVPRLVEERDKGGPLYYMRDGHWTVRGHQLCAQILCERLMKTHLHDLERAVRE